MEIQGQRGKARWQERGNIEREEKSRRENECYYRKMEGYIDVDIY